MSASTLLPDSQLFITKLDLHVNQVLQIDSSLSNGTGRFIITWLGKAIRTGSLSMNPSLTFKVDGFSEYEIWLESKNENSNVTIAMVVTTNEYPLIYLFPIGSILLILGFMICAALLKSDILDYRASKEDSRNNSKLDGQKIKFKQREVDYRVILFFTFLIILLFLTITDPYYVHNDSVGQGKSGPPGLEGNWGYEAWGYLDFAEMVRENIQSHDLNYESWMIIHGSSKSIGLSFIVGILSSFSGIDTFLVFRLTVRIFFALLCTTMGAFAFKLTKSRMGLFFGIILTLCNPVLLEYSRSLYAEIPIITLTSIAVLLLVTTPQINARTTIFIGILFCLAASFKSVMILAPIFLTLLLLVIAIFKSRKWDRQYLVRNILFLLLLGAAASLSYLLLSPMRWSAFIDKFLGISQSTGWVASNSQYILNNLLYLAVFLFLQQPIAIIFPVIVSLYLVRKRLAKPQHSMLVVLLFSTIFFNVIERRLLQHHMTYTIWVGIIIASISLVTIAKKLPNLPLFPCSQIPAPKMALVLFVIVDALLVLPWIPYSGVYMNPIGEASNFPPYFEPIYGLDESSKIIQAYPNTGYILTTGSAHVLNYYLPDRSVIYPDPAFDNCTTEFSVLTILLAYPVQFIVITDDWRVKYQETPFWVNVVTNSGEYEMIASISERGVHFANIFALSDSGL